MLAIVEGVKKRLAQVARRAGQRRLLHIIF